MLQTWITGVIGAVVIIVAYMSLDVSVLQLVLTVAGLVLIGVSFWSGSYKADNSLRRMTKGQGQ